MTSEQERAEMVVWRLEPEDAEPRWLISKWPNHGGCFISGPVILAADDSLKGLEWVRAAEVAVVPASELEAAEARYEALEERVEELIELAETVLSDGGARSGLKARAAAAISALTEQPTVKTPKDAPNG